NISVVDLAGNVLGFVRSPDAPVFGIDVSLQKARTAATLSSSVAAADLQGALFVPALGTALKVEPPSAYLAAAQSFFNDTAVFTGLTAFSDRAVGNIARPFFPDGIDGRPEGPLSRPFSQWSPFSTGLQLDVGINELAVSDCPIVPKIQEIAAGGPSVGSCPPALPNPQDPCVCDALRAAIGPPPGQPTCADPIVLS